MGCEACCRSGLNDARGNLSTRVESRGQQLLVFQTGGELVAA